MLEVGSREYWELTPEARQLVDRAAKLHFGAFINSSIEGLCGIELYSLNGWQRITNERLDEAEKEWAEVREIADREAAAKKAQVQDASFAYFEIGSDTYWSMATEWRDLADRAHRSGFGNFIRKIQVGEPTKLLGKSYRDSEYVNITNQLLSELEKAAKLYAQKRGLATEEPQPAARPPDLILAIDFEDFCEWRMRRRVDRLVESYSNQELEAQELQEAFLREWEQIQKVRAVFYKAMETDSAAATDEPQDIPGPPTPGPAETKIVRIHWKDACSVQGWHFQHEIEEQGLSLVESVGWLVGEDDSCVKLAISVSDGVAGNMTIIPKSGIVDRWEFKGE